MGLWDKLKGNHQQPKAQAKAETVKVQNPPPQTATKIEYDPGLLPKLHEEHVALLALAAQTEHAVRHDDLQNAAAYLAQFGTLLTSHLYTENIKLYLYLQYTLTPDSDEYREMRHLRKEMDGIGNVVTRCIENYRQIDRHPERKNDFLNDLAAVLPVLKKRIATEEGTLYTMYRQSH